MKKRYFNIFIVLSVVFQLFASTAYAQKKSKDIYVKIESIVADESGKPIRGASVYGNEGSFVTKTDALGKFSIFVPANTDLLVESDGYESKLFNRNDIGNLQVFQLKASEFMYGQKEDVNIPFSIVKKGDLIGAVSVIKPEEIAKYDNNQSVTSALNGRVPGMLGSSNIRGIGGALFIIDGIA